MKNKELLQQAKKALEQLENGQSYPTEYLIQRFEKASSQHSTDQLIGNMKDVFVKSASRKAYYTQDEVGKLYNQMYGLSGGQTAFRDSLGDLLPTDLHFSKVAYDGAGKNRHNEELRLEPIYKDSELSNSFSVLFSMGADNNFGTYRPGQDKSVQKAVIAKLSSMGKTPMGVDIIQTNEHFVLCAANYQTSSAIKISALIPVQITDGITYEPKHIVLGEEVVDLDSRNLFTCLKEHERNAKNGTGQKFASERGNGSKGLEVKKEMVPESLKDFADLENHLIAAASHFDSNQIKMAVSMLDSEFKSFGASGTNIKLAGSDSNSIIFDVYVPTKIGKAMIKVPVEVTGRRPLLPSRFASDKTVYDFSQKGFNSFLGSLNSKSDSVKIARETGELSKLSYQGLLDQIISGVSSQDYRLSEDALQTIQSRFGSEQFKIAFDQYSQMLKHSTAETTSRDDLIKAAFNRGDLIKVSTSVELYCPKLGLPISKVAFDEKGRVIAAGRRLKADNQVKEAAINSSRILFT